MYCKADLVKHHYLAVVASSLARNVTRFPAVTRGPVWIRRTQQCLLVIHKNRYWLDQLKHCPQSLKHEGPVATPNGNIWYSNNPYGIEKAVFGLSSYAIRTSW
jgi:hypothetical protein